MADQDYNPGLQTTSPVVFMFYAYQLGKGWRREKSTTERTKDKKGLSYLLKVWCPYHTLAQPCPLPCVHWGHQLRDKASPSSGICTRAFPSLYSLYPPVCKLRGPITSLLLLCWVTLFKILLSKSYDFCHLFGWFLRLDWTSVLQSLKAEFDYTVGMMSSPSRGPGPLRSSWHSLTHSSPCLLEVSTPVFFILQRRTWRHNKVRWSQMTQTVKEPKSGARACVLTTQHHHPLSPASHSAGTWIHFFCSQHWHRPVPNELTARCCLKGLFYELV